MSEELNAATERLERLARDHLGEYPQDDAIKALTDIEDVEPGEVPDDVLVEAARHFLDALRTADDRDPGRNYRNFVENRVTLGLLGWTWRGRGPRR